KHGVPLDADLVFDVRCLPNPHYEPALQAMTGRDPPVVRFLERFPEVERMYTDIYHFVASWLPDYARDNRNYLTVAIGCTGGRHRSVYLAERLARAFSPRYQVLTRHRELG
ncbi:MAG TPA: RNase adapter RapZ, partial [Casimicrobiaceae bacterium]|nr:RNase adapter RapZ [Casimicrobiaceae bacterium]